jgi:hypothetical protein
MRRFVIVAVVLVVVVGLLFVADIVVTNIAEERAAERVTEELDAPAEVTLHGWPVALRMLTGTIQRAEMTATDVPLEDGGTLDSLDVTLHDIEVGLGDLTDPPDGLPPARDGEFEARLSGDITWALTSVPRMLATLRIERDAVRLQTLIANMSADLRVRSNALVFEPNVPLGVLFRGEVSLDLSEQPGSPRLQTADIEGDTLVIRGTLDELGRAESAAGSMQRESSSVRGAG